MAGRIAGRANCRADLGSPQGAPPRHKTGAASDIPNRYRSEHAPVADLVLIVGPSYSSMGPSGVLRTTRRGPIVSNLAPSGLFLVGALCLSVSMYFQRQPSTTNLSFSRQNDQRQNFEWTACLDEPKRTLSLYPKKRIRCKNFAGHPAPLKNKQQSN